MPKKAARRPQCVASTSSRRRRSIRGSILAPMADRPEQPTLAAVVREKLNLSWGKARAFIASGRVHVSGEINKDAALRVDPETVEVFPGTRRQQTSLLPDESILHADRQVLVVNKAPGMLTVRYHDDDRDTLVDLLRLTLRRQGARHGKRYDPEVGVVHRLDKGTSGLLAFTRTVAAKRFLQGKFRDRDLDRFYLAIVHGHAKVGRHDTWLLANRGDGLRGSHKTYNGYGKTPPTAKRAITHVLAVKPLKGASLVVCKLETGRQHQIRIHLAEAGHPLVGENVYIRDHRDAERPIHEAPRPMLHAAVLGFEHPTRGERLFFEAEPPVDFLEALKTLGGHAKDPARLLEQARSAKIIPAKRRTQPRDHQGDDEDRGRFDDDEGPRQPNRFAKRPKRRR